MRLGFVLGEVWDGLRRNMSMVVSVVLVTFVSLTFLGAAMLLQLQINQMKTFWYDKAQVAVDLCRPTSTPDVCPTGEVSQEQRQAIENVLNGPTLHSYISSYEFENRDQAWQNFQRQFKDDPRAANVSPEFLNEAFWVSLNDPGQSDVVIERLTGQPGVEDVSDQRKYLDSIFSSLNVLSVAAISIAGLMLVAAVLLIATTIRLSAFSRRRELGIMRLVGASNRFIQTPFILEGVVAALIGSVLAGLATLGIVHFFIDGNLRQQPGVATALVGLDSAIWTFPVLVVIGCLLAGLSAKFAISRYLRV